MQKPTSEREASNTRLKALAKKVKSKVTPAHCHLRTWIYKRGDFDDRVHPNLRLIESRCEYYCLSKHYVVCEYRGTVCVLIEDVKTKLP